MASTLDPLLNLDPNAQQLMLTVVIRNIKSLFRKDNSPSRRLSRESKLARKLMSKISSTRMRRSSGISLYKGTLMFTCVATLHAWPRMSSRHFHSLSSLMIRGVQAKVALLIW